MSQKDWELGHLTDKDGFLGKPVPSGRVLVPGHIELHGEHMPWDGGGSVRSVEVSRVTLNQFVKLWSQDSARILGFAHHWGVLAIQRVNTDEPPLYRPCGEFMKKGSDPVAAWRYFSHRAYAVLNITSALNQQRLGDLADWRVISIDKTQESFSTAFKQHIYGLGWHMYPKLIKKRDPLETARRVLAEEIRMWLSCWKGRRMSGLSDFSFHWEQQNDRWELRIDYHGYLFAAIALQLALCVARVDNVYICSACNFPYIRDPKMRRPKMGAGNYCDPCKENGEGGRRSVETYREKIAEAVRLHSSGVAIDEIAVQLDRSTEQIQKWVKET